MIKPRYRDLLTTDFFPEDLENGKLNAMFCQSSVDWGQVVGFQRHYPQKVHTCFKMSKDPSSLRWQVSVHRLPGCINEPNFWTKPSQNIFLVVADGIGRIGRVLVVEVIVRRVHHECEVLELARKLFLRTDHVGRGVESLLGLRTAGRREEPEMR